MFVYFNICNLKTTQLIIIESSQKNEFLKEILQVYTIVSNLPLMLITIGLSVIYYYHSNYYSCGRLLSHFSISYLIFNDYDDDNYNSNQFVYQIIFAFCVVVFNVVILYYFRNFLKYRYDQRYEQGYDNCNREPLSKEARGSLSVNSLQQEEKEQDVDNGERMIEFEMRRLIKNEASIAVKFLWISLYFASILMTVLYMLTSSLPNDNELGINDEWQMLIIHYVLAIFLTITNVFVIPNVADIIIGYICHRFARSYVIFYLRTFSCIIIPLIFSIIFLDKCFGYWTYLWRPCMDKSKHDLFEIRFTNGLFLSDEILSNYKDICQPNNMKSMYNVTSCMRSYFDQWSPIITIKMLLFVANPWYVC